jgi:hypothetical protein
MKKKVLIEETAIGSCKLCGKACNGQFCSKECNKDYNAMMGE